MTDGNVHYPRNSITEVMEMMNQINQDNGRGRVESVVNASPSPTVRSASMGPVAVEPLSDEEKKYLIWSADHYVNLAKTYL